MENKTYFFNYIRFYKWGIGFNTDKVKRRLCWFIIYKEINFLDRFFKKRSLVYREELADYLPEHMRERLDKESYKK